MADKAPPKDVDPTEQDRRASDRRADQPSSEGRKSASVRKAIRSELEGDDPASPEPDSPRHRGPDAP
ncbi:MAG: hypothetical protein ABI205_08770, partial [Gemmatimonadaceae bacterium]